MHDVDPALLTKSPKLFTALSNLYSLKDLKRFLQLELDAYWQGHYDFGKDLKQGANQLGKATIENIIINTIAPLLAAYSLHIGKSEMMEKAIRFLEQLPPESNRYTRKFEALNRHPASAFDAQAMITLYNDFCARKKCLNCKIGSTIFSQ